MDLNCWLVTGWRGVGKTVFCQEFIRTARQKGWDAAGILSLAGFKDGIKVSIDAQDIRTGEKRSLATTQQHSETGLPFGKWFFSQKTLAWGNEVLRSSVPCDLLVVDELGPLEFNLSLGWVDALKVIRSGRFRLALVVIRPEILERAHEILQPALVIRLSSANGVNSSVQLHASLLERLEQDLSPAGTAHLLGHRHRVLLHPPRRTAALPRSAAAHDESKK
jgi:nucleoside-triphosphatase